jgi:hypothetical protein
VTASDTGANNPPLLYSPAVSPVRMGAAAPPDNTEPEGGGDAPDVVTARPGDGRRLVAAGALVVVGLPLVVAALALRRPHWYPVLDLAMTELRLRDVGTAHTPLIGLPGRIGPSLAEQGSHPGPLSFYLLAPLYRVFGSSAWAMQAATVVINLAALGAALVMAVRRGGARLGIAVATVLMLLISGYGLTMLTQPWNPYLPLLWWVVLLLAVWSVACDDLAMLPVAVFAGSFCAQTHVPYLGLAAGLGVLTVVLLISVWRRAAPGSDVRRSVTRWGAGALLLGVALWLPPLVDQAVHDPGNLRAIYNDLATPSEDPVGFGRGVELALLHLDVPGLVIGDSSWVGSLPDPSSDPDGSVIPGLVILVVWALAGSASLRLGNRTLARLHLVVAVSLVLGVISMSRIYGKEWYYLMLWAWGVAALMLLAVGWTIWAVASAWAQRHRRRLSASAVNLALTGVLVVGSAALTVDAVDTDPPEPHLSSTLGAVLPDTVAALERGDGAAVGRDGRYMVIFSDAMYFGSQSYGLVSELERAGFDVGMPDALHVPVTGHRVIGPDDAAAIVVFATGQNIELWRQVPGALEVAYVEPRDPPARAEFAELRSAVIDDLRSDGLEDLVPLVDENLFAASIDERISVLASRSTARMLELGEPTAVLIAPPHATL